MAEKDKSGSSSAEIGKYLDILAKDPNSRVFAPLAEAYRKAGLLDDAVETALEGLKVHPNYLGGRVALGRAYFEKKQYAEAAAEMQKVVKSAPDNIIAHKVLGQIAYGQNDLPAAEKAFKMVLLLDPRDQEAQQLIASIGGGGACSPRCGSGAGAGAPGRARPPAPPPPPRARAAAVRGVPHARGAAACGDPGVRPAAIPEDLSIEDITLDSPLPELGMPEPAAAPEPASPERSRRRPAAAEAIELPEIDFVEEEPALPTHAAPPELDESWELEPPPSAPAPAAPQALVVPPAPAPAPAALELEIFAREPWGKDNLRRIGSGTRAGARSSRRSLPPRPEGTPFEVFGRPKAGGPPQSLKGEREAYAEIELEPTAHAPAEAEAAGDGESPFEVFTREPREDKGRGAPAPRAGRGEGSTFRELEIETTAYTPEPPGRTPSRDTRDEPRGGAAAHRPDARDRTGAARRAVGARRFPGGGRTAACPGSPIRAAAGPGAGAGRGARAGSGARAEARTGPRTGPRTGDGTGDGTGTVGNRVRPL